MTNNKTYSIDIERLAVILLPTFLRKPRMVSLTTAMLAPLGNLLERFNAFRSQTNYRLSHNSQVCYLRAVLNDVFDPELRRIKITDIPQLGNLLIIYDRDQYKPLIIYNRNAEKPVLSYGRGFTGEGEYDFMIAVPASLGSFDQSRMRALVNEYKLAGKRFVIVIE